MSAHKALQIINSLNAEERENFRLYLQSPFHVRTGGDLLLRLFAISTDEQQHDRLEDAEYVHALLFPEKTFSIFRMQRYWSQMMETLERFLQISEYLSPKNEHRHGLDLAKALRTHHIAPLYQKHLETLKVAADRHVLLSEDNYMYRYLLAREEQEWLARYGLIQSDLGTAAVLEHLNLFYYTERSYHLGVFHIQQKFGRIAVPDIIKREITLPDISADYEQKSPLLVIRKKIESLFTESEPQREKLEALIQLLDTHEPRLEKHLLPNLHAYLRGYFTSLRNYGNLDLLPLHFQLLMRDLERGYFYVEGKILIHSLLNINRAANQTGHTEWAIAFLEEHKDKLLTETDAEAIFQVNMAICKFYQRDYEAVLSHLQHLPQIGYYMLTGKRMEIMAYYELNSELLPYKLDAFRKYLERTGVRQINDDVWRLSREFANILLQIVQSPPNDKVRSQKIIQRIKQKKLVAERQWLMDKARALGGTV